jgi:hypothetical protein
MKKLILRSQHCPSAPTPVSCSSNMDDRWAIENAANCHVPNKAYTASVGEDAKQTTWPARSRSTAGLGTPSLLARGLEIGRRPINAKCETVHKLPTFRDAYRRRRCIVPVDGFFERKANQREAQTALCYRHEGRQLVRHRWAVRELEGPHIGRMDSHKYRRSGCRTCARSRASGLPPVHIGSGEQFATTKVQSTDRGRCWGAQTGPISWSLMRPLTLPHP